DRHDTQVRLRLVGKKRLLETRAAAVQGRDDAQREMSDVGRGCRQCGKRAGQFADVASWRVVGADFQDNLEAAAGAPVTVVSGAPGEARVRAERGLKSKEAAEHDDRVLQGPMVLFVEGMLALI